MTVVLETGSSPLAMVRSLIGARSLILQLVQREVSGRYRGSVLGLVWSFFNPVLMLVVYTFVFSVVFEMRWTNEFRGGTANFAVLVFVGMIVHGVFAECVNRAPGLVLSNVNLVKRVVFPLDIIPAVAMGSTLFHATISVLVLLIACVSVHIPIPATAPLFVIVIVPLVLMTLGVSWFLASIGVFVRDLGQVIGIVTTALLFLSPVFYPTSALPEQYRFIVMVNPLTYIIDESRNVLIWGRAVDWFAWTVHTAISICIACAGYWWFQRTRRAFADVL